MKVLIVYAHPRQESLNRAILETAITTLKKNNHEAVVRDLYEMDFNPVLSAEETIHIENHRFVRDNDSFPEDVEIEMNHIRESDVLMFIYPIWWNGFPAILKGYVDRVYQHGFAYSFESDTPQKIFAGKKAFFIHTTGQPQESEASLALTAAIKRVTSEWLFNGNTTEILEHLVYGRVPYLNEDELQAILDDVRLHIEKI